jgi:hypothetical protein
MVRQKRQPLQQAGMKRIGSRTHASERQSLDTRNSAHFSAVTAHPAEALNSASGFLVSHFPRTAIFPCQRILQKTRTGRCLLQPKKMFTIQ